MNRKFILIFLAMTVALGIGCRTAPVKNVVDAPVSLHGGQSPSIAEVEKAIVTAGAGLGWRIKSQSPGNLVGTLALRDHIAVVDIKVNPETYSITYKDSTNLKYDGTDIHSNYNGWVKNLENSINAHLSGL
jgi:hypothetical protein